MTPQQRLFIGKFATGFVFADRAMQESGDLGKVAFHSYGTLELSIHAPRSPLMPWYANKPRVSGQDVGSGSKSQARVRA